MNSKSNVVNVYNSWKVRLVVMNLIVPFAGSLLLHLINVLDNNCLRYHIITGLILHSFGKLSQEANQEKKQK